MYICGEMKSSDLMKVIWKDLILLMELEDFYLKTWHLIVTEAPVQMPLLLL